MVRAIFTFVWDGRSAILVDDTFQHMTIWTIIEVECNKKEKDKGLEEMKRSRNRETTYILMSLRKMTGIEVELDSWPQASHESESG